MVVIYLHFIKPYGTRECTYVLCQNSAFTLYTM